MNTSAIKNDKYTETLKKMWKNMSWEFKLKGILATQEQVFEDSYKIPLTFFRGRKSGKVYEESWQGQIKKNAETKQHTNIVTEIS